MSQYEDFFALFGFTPTFDLDLSQLTERYRALQRSVHPDNFAAGSERERLLAVQRAASINEAFDVLSSPVRRAQYLLGLKGRARDHSQVTICDPEFLMEQMELREELEAIRHESDPEASLSKFSDRIQQALDTTVGELSGFLRGGEPAELDAAELAVAKLQFFEKLQDEITRLEDRLLGL